MAPDVTAVVAAACMSEVVRFRDGEAASAPLPAALCRFAGGWLEPATRHLSLLLGHATARRAELLALLQKAVRVLAELSGADAAVCGAAVNVDVVLQLGAVHCPTCRPSGGAVALPALLYDVLPLEAPVGCAHVRPRLVEG